MVDNIPLFDWEVHIGGKFRRRERVWFTPGYGIQCSSTTTNGYHWVAAEYVLGELVLLPYKYNREPFDTKMTLVTTNVPAELMDLAGQYLHLCLNAPVTFDIMETNKQRDVVVQPAILVLRKLIEAQGFTWDEDRKDFKRHGRVYERRVEGLLSDPAA